LKKRGFGVSKGVPTLLIASSSIDDVLAITLYTIFLSIGISQSPKSSETEFRGCGPGIKSGIRRLTFDLLLTAFELNPLLK